MSFQERFNEVAKVLVTIFRAVFRLPYIEFNTAEVDSAQNSILGGLRELIQSTVSEDGLGFGLLAKKDRLKVNVSWFPCFKVFPVGVLKRVF